MKIVYLSVYRDGTGYGHAAENLIECMDYVGLDVVPLWTTLSSMPDGTTETIENLESKDLDNVDVVIQQILPEGFCRIEGVKNVGLFFCETTHFKGSNWQYSCNLMDEIWVSTEEQKKACRDSGVTVPVTIIDIPYNFDKYEMDVKEHKDIEFSGFDNTFKFYTISDISYRKNVLGLITAYYSEFSKNDNVSLILRCYINGKDPQETEEYLTGSINQLKHEIKKDPNSYPPIIFIWDRMSDEDITRLHQTCDCFAIASRGEGECIPAFEAGAMNNWVVAPGWNGPKKIFENTDQFIVHDIIEKPVIGMGDSLSHLYNFDETWYECSLSEVSRKMREAYESPTVSESKQVLESRFSYKVVGDKLKSTLKELMNG